MSQQLSTDAARALRLVQRGGLTTTQLGHVLCKAASCDLSGTVVRAALEAGAHPDAVQHDDNPLVLAMMFANVAAVRLLCDAGADIHARTSDGQTGLVACVMYLLEQKDESATSEKEYVKALKALAAAGRDITQCVVDGRPFPMLRLAAARGYPDVVRTLLQAGASTGYDVIFGTALHEAVEGPVDAVDPTTARLERNLSCVRRLLKAGVNTRIRRHDGNVAANLVVLVGDLRAADAIFAAEGERGVIVDDDDASAREKWPKAVECERLLRAAVENYRRTGDATVPEHIRQVAKIASYKVGDDAKQAAFLATLDPSEIDENKRFITFKMLSPDDVAKRQATVGASVPRFAMDAQRCAGCGRASAALKKCPCSLCTYYCGCVRLATAASAHACAHLPHASASCSRDCQMADKEHRKSDAHRAYMAALKPSSS